MPIDKQKSECSGCTACSSVCTHGAITMEADELGFLYPKVDESKCVDCELCVKVCPFNDDYDTKDNLSLIKAFGVRHKDMNEVATSRSGAVFIALSDYILENGGVVYGVGYTDHFRVVHKRATNKAERDEFKGSKYVQSDIRGILRQIKNDLINGLTVLFSGTPCQTAGVKAFVPPRLRKNLVLIDIICHGVPSPKIWKDYISYLEKKHSGEICFVDFRDKETFGWKAHKETFRFSGIGEPKHERAFTTLFYKHIMLRDSCGNCHFCNMNRPSDITIGDFWGWEKTDPEINKDNKGLSVVFINTEKGVDFFSAIQDQVKVISANLSDCMQPNLSQPTVINSQRSKFINDYTSKGFDFIVKKYGVADSEKIHNRIRKFLSRFIPQGIKNDIRQMLSK